ncbi:MAG TPA: tRNA (adenosine(37)-N6)-threonylcarbamoyltransferase complex ATPase subunit type 1 TsaE [Candidatus Polarisedimenticolia bacterium]|nr:tRNA (adenosine(37)-N6)-threonylcarbamoyltransferase complex ATPase subunit type 1 TsaE [Candidatus Polarisedimenticolia bacterium]
MVTLSFLTDSEQGTLEAGKELAGSLAPGDVVILTGSLGAGKTVLVRGLAEGMGIDPRAVHSPTFAMVTAYGPSPSGIRLVHVDLFRLDEPAEVEELGLADLLEGGAVMAVEWGERLPARLGRGAVRVTIEDAGGDSRRITILRDADPA